MRVVRDLLRGEIPAAFLTVRSDLTPSLPKALLLLLGPNSLIALFFLSWMIPKRRKLPLV